MLRNFTRCANWEEKYLYIIELGQRLAELNPQDRNPQNTIHGCQSLVWIVMRRNANGIIELQGDSDAAIVKGLMAVVFILYHQMTAQDMCILMSGHGSKKWRLRNTSHLLVLRGWKQ